MRPALGKFLYGLAFCGVLPALLVLWARALDQKYPTLPLEANRTAGFVLLAAGIAIMLRAMWELWSLGGGLPMNAFPPVRHVARGLYGWLPHPIYLGFVVLMLGGFITARMPAGVWIVSPVLLLGILSLVIGYERMEIRRRFGSAIPSPRLALPPDAAVAPLWWHRASAYFLLPIPCWAAYQAVVHWLSAGLGRGNISAVESVGAIQVWTPYLPAVAVCWVVVSPFAADSPAALRRFIRNGWVGSAMLCWAGLVLPPSVAPVTDLIRGSLPALLVFWTLMAARLWTRWLPAFLAFAAAGVLAGVGGMGVGSLPGLAAGLVAFVLADRLDDIWRAALRATEAVANSWRDWRFGSVRIINHGGYVALAGGAGAWLVGWLLGPAFTPSIVLVSLCSLLGAGIWAQWLESSSGLSRPFGYYGSVFGGVTGVLIAQGWRGDGWPLLAAFFTAAPLIQATGRLRCLVQGCCHGRPCDGALGIRYHHPLSRVCTLAHLGGVSVYPTPLYSIIGNGVIIGLLLRLWSAGADLGLIAGVYLILSAGARFMEEGYRGEPQTVRWGGLAVYQWLALLFTAGGALCTLWPAPPAPQPAGNVLEPLCYAVPFGLLVWFAMGVDFPESNRRFSRLA